MIIIIDISALYETRAFFPYLCHNLGADGFSDDHYLENNTTMCFSIATYFVRSTVTLFAFIYRKGVIN